MPMDEKDGEAFTIRDPKVCFFPPTYSTGGAERDAVHSIHDGRERAEGFGQHHLGSLGGRHGWERAYALRAAREAPAHANSQLGEGKVCGHPQVHMLHQVCDLVQNSIQRWSGTFPGCDDGLVNARRPITGTPRSFFRAYTGVDIFIVTSEIRAPPPCQDITGRYKTHKKGDVENEAHEGDGTAEGRVAWDPAKETLKSTTVALTCPQFE